MTRRLIVRPEAQRDIEEAAFRYEIQRLGLGVRFTDQLDQLLRRITDHPFQFPEIDEGVRRGLLHRFPYAVYFATGERTIAVVAVLHQHRHPESWKRRA